MFKQDRLRENFTGLLKARPGLASVVRTGIFACFVIVLSVVGNGQTPDTGKFQLKGNCFVNEKDNFRIEMKGNGIVEVYGEGRLLTVCRTYFPKYLIKFSHPRISKGEKGDKIRVRLSHDCKDGTKVFCDRLLRIVGNAVELTTTLSISNGKDLSSYLPFKSFVQTISIVGKPYDGGRWKIGADGGIIHARSIPFESPKDWVIFKSPTLFGGNEYDTKVESLVRRISFWQKDKKLGFSVANTTKNSMILFDWSPRPKEKKPDVSYALWMYSTKDGMTMRATQIIAPAWHTDREIRAEALNARTMISFPAKERFGYFPMGSKMPAEVVISAGKETAGKYTAKFLLLDKEDKEILKKKKSVRVTQKIAGKVIYDFITPEKCGLYWMRISVKDSDNNVVASSEYPFAVTVKLPPIKDVHASSAVLGGQPMAGGYMPEGRFVGMKWDRFWSSGDTNWRNIELEKGKFNWEKCDRMVEEAIDAGTEILWCLCRTPDWASRMPQAQIYNAIAEKYPVVPGLKIKMEKTHIGERISFCSPPRDIKDWENFVRRIVRRYKDRVHYWQIWNEPFNLDRTRYAEVVGGILLQFTKDKSGRVKNASPGGFCGTIEDYANLVKSAYRIIHEEDPTAKVVVYSDYVHRKSEDEFYKTGVGDYIDILCLHYFCNKYLYTKKDLLMPSWLYNKKPATEKDNVILDFKNTHLKYTGKVVPVWNTEEGLITCISTGRLKPRPLSQEQCEKLYGKQATGEKDLWNSKMSERQGACWEVEALLFSLAMGLEKNFMHSGHGISLKRVYSIMGYKPPTEKGIVWAAAASVLNTSKRVDYCPMPGKELEAVVITDISGRKTTAIWSHTGKRKVRVQIPVGKGGHFFDFFARTKEFNGMNFLGNTISLRAKKGWLNLEVNEEPQYIYDLDPRGSKCHVEFVLQEKKRAPKREETVYRAVRPLAKSPRQINVDGKKYDWDGVAEYQVDTASSVLVGLDAAVYEAPPIRIWKGTNDLSYTVKTCWSEDGLYVLVEVRDDMVQTGCSPAYFFLWDCVEVFVDIRSLEGRMKEKTSGAVQLLVQPKLSDTPQKCRVMFAGNDADYMEAFFMGRKTEKGYMVEGKLIPKEKSGFRLSKGACIGLDIAVDDGKEPNPEDFVKRKSQMVWLGTENNYKDTSKWGRFGLRE